MYSGRNEVEHSSKSAATVAEVFIFFKIFEKIFFFENFAKKSLILLLFLEATALQGWHGATGQALLHEILARRRAELFELGDQILSFLLQVLTLGLLELHVPD